MKKLIHFWICMFLSMTYVIAQTRNIQGTVVDDTGEPLVGVSILLKGTSIGVISDVDGKFSLSATEGQTLRFSMTGMQTVEQEARQGMRVVMQFDEQMLDEVVVVAYGQQRKEAITGAVASVKAETLEKRPISAATGALEGLALGVQVNNSYGEPGAEATIRIRGFNSINGSNDPFYVVNGVPMGGNVGDINSADIESITILKDASSAALYGNKAGNGVIMITTKSGRIGEDNLVVTANLNFGAYQRGMKDYERLDAKEYMEAYWMGRRNALVTDNPAKYPNWSDANADANTAAREGLVYNIFNKDWNSLYDSNGKLSAGTEILNGYADDLDWWKPLERTGNRRDYNLNAGGGSKRASYYMSVGYLNEQGYTKQSGIERFTGNMKVDVNPAKWFKAGLSMNASNSTANYMSGGTDSRISFINPFYYARNVAPIYPVHLHDATTGNYILDDNDNKIYDDGTNGELTRPQNNARHVAWETELNKDRTYRTTLDAIAYADISFLNDFVFTIKGNLNNRNSQNKSYDNAIIGDGKGSNGRMSQTDYRYRNYLVQQLLTWKHTFGGVHNVDVLLGHENYNYMYQYTYDYKTDQKFAGLMELTNFSTMTSMNGYQQNYKTEGYLSRAGYNYDNKYFVEGSFRRDGTSRFYKDNRWGNFWSIGGSWIVSREEFMRYIDWIDYLKLRAAYGETGQDDGASYYAWMALYYSATNGGNGALYKSQNEARDVNWETTGSFSAAVETRLFDRANLSVEYFDKRSIDLLFNVTMPSSMGGVVNGTATGSATSSTGNRPTVLKNLGTVSNRGLEIGLDVDVIKTRNLTWNIGTNFNYINTKVVKLPDEYKEDGYISGQFKRMEGHGIYDYWLYQYAGIDKSDGRSLYLLDAELFYIPDDGYTGSGAKTDDETRTVMAAGNYKIINGEAYVYNTTYAKKDWSGTAQPNVFGSFTTSLEFKGFQLSGLVTYALGAKTYDQTYLNLMSISAAPSALHVDILKSWTPDQAGTGIDPNGTPALNTTQSSFSNAGMSTRWLISGNYFTVKNITLSYSVPQRPLAKIGLKGLVVSATGENLAIFTKLQGMNSQQSWTNLSDNAFAPSRILSMGLNVKF
ncbi:MAG: SusC/RagA family TonB-linked outer membrane protein [Tannerella sp.]|jgi:TonB-linked SusC/RagA family outer membrane protein|nr:SusC/RagA family TonB-linked outer membrane protein [Tannerella sp.]